MSFALCDLQPGIDREHQRSRLDHQATLHRDPDRLKKEKRGLTAQWHGRTQRDFPGPVPRVRPYPDPRVLLLLRARRGGHHLHLHLLEGKQVYVANHSPLSSPLRPHKRPGLHLRCRALLGDLPQCNKCGRRECKDYVAFLAHVRTAELRHNHGYDVLLLVDDHPLPSPLPERRQNALRALAQTLPPVPLSLHRCASCHHCPLSSYRVVGDGQQQCFRVVVLHHTQGECHLPSESLRPGI